MGRFAGTVIAAGAAAALAGTAIACPPPPPFPPPPELAAGAPAADKTAWAQAWDQAWTQSRGEQERAWALKQQTRLFNEAKALVIVRYDHEGKTSGHPKADDYLNGQRLAVLKPVRWVKGKATSGDLQLELKDAEMCMKMPAHDAFYGKPGDVFVIYLKSGKLKQDDVLEGFALDRIVEPKTLAAVTGG